ncbi:MAG: glycosyltransferase family 4 protein [Bacteroidota bacterium]
MKVLFLARHDLYINIGGDTIQVDATAKYLRLLGVTIDIKLSTDVIDYAAYQLIHFFNIIDPEDILGHVLKSNKPYVVSTIYVDYSEYDKNHRQGLVGLLAKWIPTASIEYLKTLAKYILKGEKVSTPYFFVKGHKNSIQYILKHAKCLLPNSLSEYKRLARDFGSEYPFEVIPNAIDKSIFVADNNTERENLVLCVARLEGRKNQLNLIKALSNTNIQLLLIGKESTNQKGYVNQCRLIAGNNVTFLPFVSQSELLKYYKKAKVHVLPSWFETTGLSSLEAAAMGCNIVVADKGDVREYFGDLAYYCEPDKPESIAAAVNAALNNPVSKQLQEKVCTAYTWEKAAEQTLKAYKRVTEND